MSKSTAFAVATQEAYATGKAPKGFGTPEGKAVAKEKYDLPKKAYEKTPNPGKLDSPKLASVSEGELKRYKYLMKFAFALSQYSGPTSSGPPLQYASGIPPWREEPVIKTSGPPSQPRIVDKSKAAAAALYPASRLASTKQVGAPRTTAPPGPSIAEVSKPKGYGRVLPGAGKG
jgi:hypothetical protein